jgi:hypothetical protein
MRANCLPLLALCAIAAASSPARAIEIHYVSTPLGSDSYEFEYAVANDGSLGAGVPVLLFDILFDPNGYDESSLAIVSPASVTGRWSELILGSAPGVPAAYDALATAGGIADGASESGFAVRFHWLGPGTPGPQPFEIFDPNTFEQIGGGVTSLPEAAPLWLAAGGAALCLALRRTSLR